MHTFDCDCVAFWKQYLIDYLRKRVLCGHMKWAICHIGKKTIIMSKLLAIVNTTWEKRVICLVNCCWLLESGDSRIDCYVCNAILFAYCQWRFPRSMRKAQFWVWNRVSNFNHYISYSSLFLASDLTTLVVSISFEISWVRSFLVIIVESCSDCILFSIHELAQLKVPHLCKYVRVAVSLQISPISWY